MYDHAHFLVALLRSTSDCFSACDIYALMCVFFVSFQLLAKEEQMFLKLVISRVSNNFNLQRQARYLYSYSIEDIIPNMYEKMN